MERMGKPAEALGESPEVSWLAETSHRQISYDQREGHRLK